MDDIEPAYFKAIKIANQILQKMVTDMMMGPTEVEQ